MPLSRSAQVTLDAPSADVDLESWVFGLSDLDYQACARGHHAAGVFADEQGRGTINVETVGGNLAVQHYRPVRAGRSHVEMHSPASRIYVMHLVPVPAGVRWTLDLTPATAASSTFTCTVQLDLPGALGIVGRLMLLGWFLQRHVHEETRGFAADIARKLRPATSS